MLDEILGSYAAAFLLFIVLFIILIFVIVIVYLVRKKFVEIVCLDRIKDITTVEEAKFDITLQNPSKKTLTYEIHTEMESEAEKIYNEEDLTKAKNIAFGKNANLTIDKIFRRSRDPFYNFPTQVDNCGL